MGGEDDSEQVIHKNSTHTRISVSYALGTMNQISNPKDQLYSQLVKFIKVTVEVIKNKI